MPRTMFESESIPVLANALNFAAERNKVIANNIANIDTPGFHARDLRVDEFKKMLGRAIDDREARHPFEFRMRRTPHIAVKGGSPVFEPYSIKSDGVRRHDRNNVIIEREMSKLAKNAMYAKISQQFLVKKFRQLETAISGRVT